LCRALLSGALACWTTTVMSGDWAYLTPDEMAAQSALIVIGRLVGHEQVRWTDAAPPMNVGVIAVEEVLKGEPGQRVALIELPPTRPKGLFSSSDVRLADGAHGLWYLRRRAEGLYQIDRPDRFIRFEVATERIKALQATNRQARGKP
jgi:hypothetical protein